MYILFGQFAFYSLIELELKFRIGTKVVRVPIEDNEDDAVDDVYGMDWNEEDDRNESSRDEF